MSTAAAVAQINARIAPDLKAAGDAALASAGFSPTQAVRALWELAAQWSDAPEKIRESLMTEREREALEEEREERIALAKAGPRIIEDAYAQMGIEPPHEICTLTYEELKELAYKDRGML